jgi:putative hydrolase of HD superfamily
LLLDFFNIIANLKNIPRQGWIDKLNIEKSESVSDHTFSLTMMAMIYSDIQKLDTLKVLKMSLLHDVVESITGDLTPEQITKEEKVLLENKTFRDIIKKLPKEFSDDFLKIWKEFQENLTAESKLVHDVDKLEMALQAKIYEKKGFKNTKSFFNSAEKQIQNKELKEMFRQIINQ